MHLGPIGHPMSEVPVSRDQFFNLYLAFEIELNILFYFISLIRYRKTSSKLEANCSCSLSEIIIIIIIKQICRRDVIFRKELETCYFAC